MKKVDTRPPQSGHAAVRRAPLHTRMARAVACALMIGVAPLWAAPAGEQVVAGQAAVSRSGSNTLISQTTERAAINWQSFNIGATESVRFAQPSASSITLNRVLGQNPTAILGSLSANGQIFILNPNGVLFGRGAQVNVGGLVASTLSLSNDDFMAGRYRFTDGALSPGGQVVNQGEITANGGYVALISPQVKNEGTIRANGGVALAAGDGVTVNLNGNRLIGLSVEQGALNAVAGNGGLIQTGGGTVILTAKAMDQIIKSVVNNSGIVEATSITGAGGTIGIESDIITQTGTLAASGTQGGSITLDARAIIDAGTAQARGTAGDGGRIGYRATEGIVQTASARLDASGTVAGGSIRLESANTLFSSGTLIANGQTGGTIDVLGRNIALAAATLDASGTARGGNIRIGGDFHGANPGITNARSTYVNGATRIKADGGHGTVVVWSDETTGFYGNASALDGGAIEISSHGTLTYAGSASAGMGGTLLLDPANIIIDSAGGPAAFALVDPHAAAGNQFGANVTLLGNTVNGVFTPSGKVVIAVPTDSLAAAGAGAAYLFDINSGALVSTLIGTAANDAVGSGGVTALANGNYVVASSYWNSGRGAATWGSGANGVAGAVTAANSLVGTTPGDYVSNDGIAALTNGNYVVASSFWNGTMGAATWGSGASGVTGDVTAANSLVGTVAGDYVGSGHVTALANGNYVVVSGSWNNTSGAATWGSGTGGVTGDVTAANSLVGAAVGDFVGSNGVTALANGNYVVASSNWDSSRGAATWGDGASGVTGVVSAGNSLVGSVASDAVASGGIRALSNGNYVVASSNWDSSRGAATWGNGASGVTGVVSAGNSLVGSVASDAVAGGGITALANGNYVVASSAWDGSRGAATWGNGASGVTGVVSAGNSLVGSVASDAVGDGGITALTNGNYVVASGSWNSYAGAVTWGSGTTGVTGVVSAGNSLVGAAAGDYVGSNGVTALTNGNYVVASGYWDNSRGAATWGDGTSGVTGVVSAGNSLVGSVSSDAVAGGGIRALSNGNYVVASSAWDSSRGAATWGNGASGVTGVVSAGNSLVGSVASDAVGDGGITALANGNYVVASSAWDSSRGAATWGNGASGVTGVVSVANSLVGSAAGDTVSSSGINALANGNYLVRSGNHAANAGQVLIGTPGNLLFQNGTGQTMMFNASGLSDTLASGTAVSLQASNDITVNASINVAGASGGALTLQAGRHITLNASITTANGDFTAIAGDPGAITADRLAGTPTITLGNGASINAGTGLVTLAAIGGNFINNSLSATPITAGRWLVWSSDPANNTRGAIPYDFKQYNATYGVTTPAQSTGNGFLYTLAPTLTPVLTGTVSKVYDAATTATLAAGNYIVSAVVDGDTVVLNNPVAGTYGDSNVGTLKNVAVSGIAIASASNGAATVYGYQLGSTTVHANIGAITPIAPGDSSGTNSLPGATPLPPEVLGALASVYTMEGGTGIVAGTASGASPQPLLTGLSTQLLVGDLTAFAEDMPGSAVSSGAPITGDLLMASKAPGGLITVVGDGVNLPRRRSEMILGSLE